MASDRRGGVPEVLHEVQREGGLALVPCTRLHENGSCTESAELRGQP
ncbi:MAG: hypothetical protein WCP63_04850 [Cyanobium sp. ELA712]